MALSKAIEGSNHTAQGITWKDERGNAVDLTGATITGIKQVHDDITAVTAIDGTLTSTNNTGGVFSWTYGTNDIATAGSYIVEFRATYGDSTIEKSLLEEFTVERTLATPA